MLENIGLLSEMYHLVFGQVRKIHKKERIHLNGNHQQELLPISLVSILFGGQKLNQVLCGNHHWIHTHVRWKDDHRGIVCLDCLFDHDELTTCRCTIAYLLAATFLSVFSFSATTILHCFIID